MHQLKTMPLSFWKIDHWPLEFAPRFAVLHAGLTWDMFSKVKATPYLLMSVGASTLLP
jgi:hypothetical protein